MNKIEPTYVTFEQARLLADKKFLVHTRYGYTKDGALERPYYGETYINSDFENSLTYSAPEQWQVVEWLRANHGIWVCVNIAIDDKWYFELYNLKDKRNAEIIIENEDITDFYNIPQAAYSVAFDYILNNLI